MTVALSSHRWTPLKRCGFRSGNMKKTEHVPSTGRPSSRGRRPANPPELPSNPPIILSETCILLHLSSPGTSASSFINPAASVSLLYPPPPHPPRETHTFMCGRFHMYLFRSFVFLLFASFPAALPAVGRRCPHQPQSKHSHSEGRQGISEGNG